MGTFEEAEVLKRKRQFWDGWLTGALIFLFFSWIISPISHIFIGIGVAVLSLLSIWVFGYLSDRHQMRLLDLCDINMKKTRALKTWRLKTLPMNLEGDLLRAKHRARISRDMQRYFQTDEILLSRYIDIEYDAFRTLEKAEVI